MSRIPIASLANGVLFATESFASPSNPAGVPVLTPAVGVHCFVYAHGTATPVTVYTDEAGSTPIATPLVSDGSGAVPGWVDASLLPLDLSVALPSGNVTFVLSGGGGAGGTVTRQAVIDTGLVPGDIGAAAASSLSALAPLASPALTGTPTAPTATNGDNSTKLATTAFVLANAGAGGTPGGDASGTIPALQVNTVLGGKIPVEISRFLGFSQVVRPSGDATGATDVTNINAALAAGTNTSIYLNGNHVVNAAITIPSNMTLVLADAKITLANGSNSPIITNPSYASTTTPQASNIHVRGIGRAMLDYNGANQTAQANTPWVEASVMLVNVTNFSIRDLQSTNNIYVPYWFQACSNGRVQSLHHTVGATDLGFIHADIGCNHIVFDGLSADGDFPDSVISMNSVANSAFPAVSETPFAHLLAGSARWITNLTWRNISLSSGTGLFCVFLDANGQCNDIDISNVHNTYTGTATNYEFNTGPVGYHLRTIPPQGAMSGWRVNGYTMSGQNHVFMGLDTPITDFQATNIRVGGNGTCAGLIGNQFAPTSVSGYYPQMTRIKLSDVHIPTLAGPLCAIAAGVVASEISMENIRIGVANAPLLQNVSDVTGLHMSNVRIGTLNAPMFQSTGYESGVVRDVSYTAKGSALTQVLSRAPTFRIAQPFPALASADATPVPIHGSEILAYNTKDPTGGAGTTGGRYVADGQGWALANSGNSVFRPGQLYRRQLFHYDAGSIVGLSNGASVSRWPDSGPSASVLVQATGANQPTYVAADSILNNKPSVSFNGTTAFLQNGPLTPIIRSGAGSTEWVDVFIVYYWTTLGASIVADVASIAAGSAAHGFYLLRNSGTNKDEVANVGGAGPTPTTLVVNTALITYFAVSPTTFLYIADNKLLQSSETSSHPGAATNLCTGLTLGAGYTGTSQAAVNIAEVVGYYGTSQIGASDWASVMTGLASKYAVTLS